jgi:hypothetical protein
LFYTFFISHLATSSNMQLNITTKYGEAWIYLGQIVIGALPEFSIGEHQLAPLSMQANWCTQVLRNSALITVPKNARTGKYLNQDNLGSTHVWLRSSHGMMAQPNLAKMKIAPFVKLQISEDDGISIGALEVVPWWSRSRFDFKQPPQPTTFSSPHR